MPQTAETAGFRLIKGDGADAGAAVPHPDACLIAVVCGGICRRQCHRAGLFAPFQRHCNGNTVRIGDGVLERLVGVDDLSVHRTDEVAGLDACLLCRTAPALRSVHPFHAHHHSAVHAELDAERLAAGDEHGRVDLLDFHLLDGNDAEEPEGCGLGSACRCGCRLDGVRRGNGRDMERRVDFQLAAGLYIIIVRQLPGVICRSAV